MPLKANAQEEPSAHLFLINGQILNGEIISISDRTVLFKTAQHRKSEFSKIPFEDIQKLFSAKGQIILSDGKIVLTYIENSSLISRANEAWTIFPINGTNQFGVIPVVVKTDSLIYYEGRTRRAMHLQQIREISMIRGASVGGSAAKGALIGALSGALSLGYLADQECGDAEGICPVGAIMLVGLIGGLVVGLTIGTIIGSSKARDRIINLRNLTLPQKKEKLGAEFGFYQDWSPNQ
ncbi:MAG: hypothetical protein IIB40_01455 [Candidatus Marinimicrobia bacterium]|nr:hypothetical protein [Candidatus Neomarinimicrobiota bacterium]